MRGTARVYAAFVALSVALIVVAGPLAGRIAMVGADDLSRIWAGPRAVVTGHDPYDPATWHATAVTLGTQPPDTAVYIYPPWVAVALLPLGAVDLRVASAVWLGLGLVAAVGVVHLYVRDRLPRAPADQAIVALALLLSWVGLLTLIIGQWGYLLVAALLGSVELLRRRHPVGAGLAALAMLAKPQLFILAAPAFAVRALWPETRRGAPPRDGVRAVAAAIAGAVVLLALGELVLPSWWPVWITSVGAQQTRPFSDTLPALLLTVGGPTAMLATPLVLLALVAVALAFTPRGDAWLAVWTALSIVAAPYTNSYDQIVLLVPIVLAASALRDRDVRAARVALWGGCAVLLIATPILYDVATRRHSETLGAIVPLAVLAIVTGSLWRWRRAPASLAA